MIILVFALMEKVKIHPVVHLTGMTKSAAKLIRNSIFPRDMGAVVKCHNDSLESLLLSYSVRDFDLKNHRL